MIHYALILAGGDGSRLSNTTQPKQFLNINGIPMLMHSIRAFSKAFPNTKIYIGIQKKHKSIWKNLCQKHEFNLNHQIYLAGQERLHTVFLGLKCIFNEFGLQDAVVSIHDAARPFIDSNFILNLLNSFGDKDIKAAVPVLNLKNAIIQYKNNNTTPLNRNNYLLCQTPQCFKFKDILKAYNYIMNNSSNSGSPKPSSNNILERELHDDLTVFRQLFKEEKNVKLLEGRIYNIKITTDLDYFISEQVNNYFNKIG